jgi:hypothetical protein
MVKVLPHKPRYTYHEYVSAIAKYGSQRKAAAELGVSAKTLKVHLKRGPDWKPAKRHNIIDPITRKFISVAVYEANKLEAAVKNAENREEKAHGRSDVMAHPPPEEAVRVRKKKKRRSECKDGVPAIVKDRTTGRLKRNDECGDDKRDRIASEFLDKQIAAALERTSNKSR